MKRQSAPDTNVPTTASAAAALAEDDPAKWTVGRLKAFLTEKGATFETLTEKSELVEVAREKMLQSLRNNANNSNNNHDSNSESGKEKGEALSTLRATLRAAPMPPRAERSAAHWAEVPIADGAAGACGADFAAEVTYLRVAAGRDVPVVPADVAGPLGISAVAPPSASAASSANGKLLETTLRVLILNQSLSAPIAEALAKASSATSSSPTSPSSAPKQPLPAGARFLQHLILGTDGGASAARALTPKAAAAQKVCGKTLGRRDMIFRCLECAADPTCVMCADCFNNSPCVNHEYRMSPSGGGMCDCGDPSAWKAESFCCNHGGASHTDDPTEGLNPLDKQWLSAALRGAALQCIVLLRFLVGAHAGTITIEGLSAPLPAGAANPNVNAAKAKVRSTQIKDLQAATVHVEEAFQSLIDMLKRLAGLGEAAARMVFDAVAAQQSLEPPLTAAKQSSSNNNNKSDNDSSASSSSSPIEFAFPALATIADLSAEDKADFFTSTSLLDELCREDARGLIANSLGRGGATWKAVPQLVRALISDMSCKLLIMRSILKYVDIRSRPDSDTVARSERQMDTMKDLLSQEAVQVLTVPWAAEDSVDPKKLNLGPQTTSLHRLLSSLLYGLSDLHSSAPSSFPPLKAPFTAISGPMAIMKYHKPVEGTKMFILNPLHEMRYLLFASPLAGRVFGASEVLMRGLTTALLGAHVSDVVRRATDENKKHNYFAWDLQLRVGSFVRELLKSVTVIAKTLPADSVASVQSYSKQLLRSAILKDALASASSSDNTNNASSNKKKNNNKGAADAALAALLADTDLLLAILTSKEHEAKERVEKQQTGKKKTKEARATSEAPLPNGAAASIEAVLDSLLPSDIRETIAGTLSFPRPPRDAVRQLDTLFESQLDKCHAALKGPLLPCQLGAGGGDSLSSAEAAAAANNRSGLLPLTDRLHYARALVATVGAALNEAATVNNMIVAPAKKAVMVRSIVGGGSNAASFEALSPAGAAQKEEVCGKKATGGKMGSRANTDASVVSVASGSGVMPLDTAALHHFCPIHHGHGTTFVIPLIRLLSSVVHCFLVSENTNPSALLAPLPTTDTTSVAATAGSDVAARRALLLERLLLVCPPFTNHRLKTSASSSAAASPIPTVSIHDWIDMPLRALLLKHQVEDQLWQRDFSEVLNQANIYGTFQPAAILENDLFALQFLTAVVGPQSMAAQLLCRYSYVPQNDRHAPTDAPLGYAHLLDLILSLVGDDNKSSCSRRRANANRILRVMAPAGPMLQSRLMESVNSQVEDDDDEGPSQENAAALQAVVQSLTTSEQQRKGTVRRLVKDKAVWAGISAYNPSWDISSREAALREYKMLFASGSNTSGNKPEPHSAEEFPRAIVGNHHETLIDPIRALLHSGPALATAIYAVLHRCAELQKNVDIAVAAAKGETLPKTQYEIEKEEAERRRKEEEKGSKKGAARRGNQSATTEQQRLEQMMEALLREMGAGRGGRAGGRGGGVRGGAGGRGRGGDVSHSTTDDDDDDESAADSDDNEWMFADADEEDDFSDEENEWDDASDDSSNDAAAVGGDDDNDNDSDRFGSDFDESDAVDMNRAVSASADDEEDDDEASSPTPQREDSAATAASNNSNKKKKASASASASPAAASSPSFKRKKKLPAPIPFVRVNDTFLLTSIDLLLLSMEDSVAIANAEREAARREKEAKAACNNNKNDDDANSNASFGGEGSSAAAASASAAGISMNGANIGGIGDADADDDGTVNFAFFEQWHRRTIAANPFNGGGEGANNGNPSLLRSAFNADFFLPLPELAGRAPHLHSLAKAPVVHSKILTLETNVPTGSTVRKLSRNSNAGGNAISGAAASDLRSLQQQEEEQSVAFDGPRSLADVLPLLSRFFALELEASHPSHIKTTVDKAVAEVYLAKVKKLIALIANEPPKQKDDGADGSADDAEAKANAEREAKAAADRAARIKEKQQLLLARMKKKQDKVSAAHHIAADTTTAPSATTAASASDSAAADSSTVVPNMHETLVLKATEVECCFCRLPDDGSVGGELMWLCHAAASSNVSALRAHRGNADRFSHTFTDANPSQEEVMALRSAADWAKVSADAAVDGAPSEAVAEEAARLRSLNCNSAFVPTKCCANNSNSNDNTIVTDANDADEKNKPPSEPRSDRLSVSVMTCGHAAHMKCVEKQHTYLNAQRGRSIHELHMERRGFRGMEFLGGAEFCCPICSKISTVLSYMPRLLTTSTAAGATSAPAADGEDSKVTTTAAGAGIALPPLPTADGCFGEWVAAAAIGTNPTTVERIASSFTEAKSKAKQPTPISFFSSESDGGVSLPSAMSRPFKALVTETASGFSRSSDHTPIDERRVEAWTRILNISAAAAIGGLSGADAETAAAALSTGESAISPNYLHNLVSYGLSIADGVALTLEGRLKLAQEHPSAATSASFAPNEVPLSVISNLTTALTTVAVSIFDEDGSAIVAPSASSSSSASETNPQSLPHLPTSAEAIAVFGKILDAAVNRRTLADVAASTSSSSTSSTDGGSKKKIGEYFRFDTDSKKKAAMATVALPPLSAIDLYGLLCGFTLASAAEGAKKAVNTSANTAASSALAAVAEGSIAPTLSSTVTGITTDSVANALSSFVEAAVADLTDEATFAPFIAAAVDALSSSSSASAASQTIVSTLWHLLAQLSLLKHVLTGTLPPPTAVGFITPILNTPTSASAAAPAPYVMTERDVEAQSKPVPYGAYILPIGADLSTPATAHHHKKNEKKEKEAEEGESNKDKEEEAPEVVIAMRKVLSLLEHLCPVMSSGLNTNDTAAAPLSAAALLESLQRRVRSAPLAAAATTTLPPLSAVAAAYLALSSSAATTATDRSKSSDSTDDNANSNATAATSTASTARLAAPIRPQLISGELTVTQATRARCSDFAFLPRNYHTYIQHLATLKNCSHCGLGSPAFMCLCCRQLLCLRSQTGRPEVFRHAQSCGGGVGIFVMLRNSDYVIVSGVNERASQNKPVYVDRYGEYDESLSRGVALNLNFKYIASDLLTPLITNTWDHDPATLKKAFRNGVTRL